MFDIMANVKSKKPEKPTLYVGTGTPYIALFDESSQPILNPLTNLPLGLYMNSFRYTFQEANSRSSGGFRKNTNPGNEGKLVFMSDDPDTIDISGLQKNAKILIQYGYIFPDGSFLTSPIISTVIRQIDAIFDNNGVTITVTTKDKSDLMKYKKPYSPLSDKDTFLKWLKNGCGYNVGVIIKKF